MKVKIFIIFCIALVGSAIANAESKKEEYELQERCGKRADERFKREYGDRISRYDAGQWVYHYTNHYNKKLNKCFVLIRGHISEKDGGFMEFEQLWDINAHKEYGYFMRDRDKGGKVWSWTSCFILDKMVDADKEKWDPFVVPYMEE